MDRWRNGAGTELYPKSRKALPCLVQGSAADILSLAICRWWRHPERHPGSRIWLALQDELIVECPIEVAEPQLEMLKSTMEFEINTVPFTCAGASIMGTHWT